MSDSTHLPTIVVVVSPPERPDQRVLMLYGDTVPPGFMIEETAGVYHRKEGKLAPIAGAALQAMWETHAHKSVALVGQPFDEEARSSEIGAFVVIRVEASEDVDLAFAVYHDGRVFMLARQRGEGKQPATIITEVGGMATGPYWMLYRMGLALAAEHQLPVAEEEAVP